MNGKDAQTIQSRRQRPTTRSDVRGFFRMILLGQEEKRMDSDVDRTPTMIQTRQKEETERQTTCTIPRTDTAFTTLRLTKSRILLSRRLGPCDTPTVSLPRYLECIIALAILIRHICTMIMTMTILYFTPLRAHTIAVLHDELTST